MFPYLIAVVGPSGSGKTRLIERLVPFLNKRGLRVGVVKHAHDRVDLDRPGKDSWRCLKAGAKAVAVVGPKQVLVVKRRTAEDGLPQALGSLPRELDLVLLEGFHRAKVLQIAVADPAGEVRKGDRILAVVSDRPLRQAQGRPVRCPARRFRSNQIRELAALIDREWTQQWEAACPLSSPASCSAAV